MSKVFRQSLRNRLVHWGIAFSCFGLIVTGILQMPVAKRYGITEVFPSTADFLLLCLGITLLRVFSPYFVSFTLQCMPLKARLILCRKRVISLKV